LVLAPALETPERDAKRQQLLEILLAWQGRVTFLACGEAVNLRQVLADEEPV
jgi:hypothetical protein